MATASILLASFLTAVAAQTTAQQTLVLPFVGADSTDNGTTLFIDASVVAVQGSATTMVLGCPDIDYSDDTTACGADPDETLIYGPSTYNLMYNDPGDFTFTADCSLGGTTTAVCAESADGSSANFPGSSTTDYSDIAYMTVTVTDGASLLGSTGATASPGSTGSSAASQTSSASGSSSAMSSSSSASAGSAAGSSSQAASSSGAGMTSAGMTTATSMSKSGSASASAAASSSTSAAGAGHMAPEQAFGVVGAAALMFGALAL